MTPARGVFALVVVLGLAGTSAQAQGARPGPRVNAREYEGWRQYSAQCARCHGQDVVGNPVAADLLKSTGSGGPTASKEAFTRTVKAGRPARGMPGFAKTLDDQQVDAIYTYVKGRADGRIAAGRPERPKG